MTQTLLHLTRALIAGFGVAAFQLGAQAQHTEFDFRGVIVNTGYDTTGVYSSPGTVLNGMSWAANLVFDFSFGSRAIGPHSDSIVGGPAVAESMPLLRGGLTINGTTVPFKLDGHVSMSMSIHSAGLNSFEVYLSSYHPPLHDDLFRLSLASTDFPLSLTTPAIVLNPTGGGNFQDRTDLPTGGGHERFALGQLDVYEVKISTISAVPEPESFALYAFGLATILWARRRRIFQRIH